MRGGAEILNGGPNALTHVTERRVNISRGHSAGVGFSWHVKIMMVEGQGPILQRKGRGHQKRPTKRKKVMVRDEPPRGSKPVKI